MWIPVFAWGASRISGQGLQIYKKVFDSSISPDYFFILAWKWNCFVSRKGRLDQPPLSATDTCTSDSGSIGIVL